MQSDIIKPTFVPTFDVVVNSSMVVSIGTDRAEYVEAIMDDPSRPVGKHFLYTSWSMGAQIQIVALTKFLMRKLCGWITIMVV